MADVITLPVIRIERGRDDEQMVRVALRARDYKRLMARAKEWSVSIEDAGAYVIEQALAPKR